MGPTILLPIYNTIFSVSLETQLRAQVPQVDVHSVVESGVTTFRDLVSPEDLPAVLEAYADSVSAVFYLVAAMGALAFCVAWGMSWQDIRKKGEPATTNPSDPDTELETLANSDRREIRYSRRYDTRRHTWNGYRTSWYGPAPA